MTESRTTAEETAELPTAPITFLGREIYVRFPRPEQIVVWQRIMRRLEASDPDSWTGAEVVAALDKILAILDSIVADPKDKSWLEDEFLAGRIGLREAAPFLTETLKAYRELAETDLNRAERRAAQKAAPVKKATRKPPAPKAAPARKATR